MNDAVEIAIIGVVLGVQLIGPLVIGWREINAPPAPGGVSTRSGTSKGAKLLKRKAGAAVDLPALAPLRCAACQAPVPLLSTSFACPHCAAAITPPADYVTALTARLRSDVLLGRAERMWRRSRIVCAWPTVWLMRLALVAWTVLVIGSSYAAADRGVPGMVMFLPIIVAIVQVFLGFFLISVIGDGRKELPPLPPRSELAVVEANGACAGCAAPFVFAAGRLGATCRYCGAENFRAALAKKASDDAVNDEGEAKGSLMDQIRAHDARRHEYLSFFTLIGIAEIFYGVFIPIAWLADQLGL